MQRRDYPRDASRRTGPFAQARTERIFARRRHHRPEQLASHKAQSGDQRQSQHKQRDLPPDRRVFGGMHSMAVIVRVGVMVVAHGKDTLRADNQHAIGVLRAIIAFG